MANVVEPPAATHPLQPQAAVTIEQVTDEELAQHLEEALGFEDAFDLIAEDCLEHFREAESSPLERYASEITRNYIKEDTRNRHIRITKAYTIHNWKRDRNWDPRAVTQRTPQDIVAFIMYKCGDKERDCQGHGYATAIATRAALTLWYRSVRPNERTDEWRLDESGVWRGLPTRSLEVSRYMMGLEKTLASAGKVAQSVRGILMEDLHRLHEHMFRPGQNTVEQRRSVLRYCAYGLAFLMMLRINEVLKITFENVENIPGKRDVVTVVLGPRKTSQTRNHSYDLYANDDDPRLCPKRMFILIGAIYGRGFNPTGPVFRHINGCGHIEPTKVLTTAVLQRGLMSDLQALGYTTWAMYGTHSFRRGGCQYRLKVKRWTPDMIAYWGDWTQVEAVTMFRYFYSPNDNHAYAIEYDRNYPRRVCVPHFT